MKLLAALIPLLMSVVGRILTALGFDGGNLFRGG
ncbi:phage associated protein [Neisseria meningitidis]|nr:phage associated protein [Neisseria meningitidis]